MHKLAIVGLVGLLSIPAFAQNRNPFVPPAPKPSIVAPQPEMPSGNVGAPVPPASPSAGPVLAPTPSSPNLPPIPSPGPGVGMLPPLQPPAPPEPPKEIEVRKSGKRLGVVNGYEVYRTEDGYVFRNVEDLPVLKFVPELPSPSKNAETVPGMPELPPPMPVPAPSQGAAKQAVPTLPPNVNQTAR